MKLYAIESVIHNTIQKFLTLYHVKPDERVWLDGGHTYSYVRDGIPTMGCKTYPNGAFVVGLSSNINPSTGILHIYGSNSEAFTDLATAMRYFSRKLNQLN